MLSAKNDGKYVILELLWRCKNYVFCFRAADIRSAVDVSERIRNAAKSLFEWANVIRKIRRDRFIETTSFTAAL